MNKEEGVKQKKKKKKKRKTKVTIKHDKANKLIK